MSYPDHTDPRVAKAIRKAQRPWYQKKRFLIPLGLVGLIFIGSAISSVSRDSVTTQNRPGVPSGVDPSQFNPTPVSAPGGLSVETWTETPGGWVAPTPSSSGPLTEFSSGTYEVGAGSGEVAPGKYKTTGPESGDWGSCYWARLKNTNGDFDSIITNGNAEGPTTITISKSDGAFETRCTWAKIS